MSSLEFCGFRQSVCDKPCLLQNCAHFMSSFALSDPHNPVLLEMKGCTLHPVLPAREHSQHMTAATLLTPVLLSI